MSDSVKIKRPPPLKKGKTIHVRIENVLSSSVEKEKKTRITFSRKKMSNSRKKKIRIPKKGKNHLRKKKILCRTPPSAAAPLEPNPNGCRHIYLSPHTFSPLIN